MSASSQTGLAPHLKNIKKLGIIAGSGSLPGLLAERCQANNIEPLIISLAPNNDLERFYPRTLTYGRVGEIPELLKSENINDLIMIGALDRPSFKDLNPNLKTLKLINKIGFKSILSKSGDDGLLRALRKVFEDLGIHVHGVHSFLPELLTPFGMLGDFKPSVEQSRDVQIGIMAAQELGRADKGQAVIVYKGEVIGREDQKGTNALIKSCAHQNGGVLVKLAKPQQDERLDLPTIGPNTIMRAAEAGLEGVAVQAQKSLIVDRERVIALANKHQIFIIGVEIGKDQS